MFCNEGEGIKKNLKIIFSVSVLFFFLSFSRDKLELLLDSCDVLLGNSTVGVSHTYPGSCSWSSKWSEPAVAQL